MTPTSPATPEAAAEPLVLIVDDSEPNRRLVRDVLRADGLRTLEAATGGEAIALAAARLPDVILMDLRLTDMGGADATRALRETPSTARIPVVALSALPRADEWLEASGFAGYVEKPFDVRELPARVRDFSAHVTRG